MKADTVTCALRSPLTLAQCARDSRTSFGRSNEFRSSFASSPPTCPPISRLYNSAALSSNCASGAREGDGITNKRQKTRPPIKPPPGRFCTCGARLERRPPPVDGRTKDASAGAQRRSSRGTARPPAALDRILALLSLSVRRRSSRFVFCFARPPMIVPLFCPRASGDPVRASSAFRPPRGSCLLLVESEIGSVGRCA